MSTVSDFTHVDWATQVVFVGETGDAIIHVETGDVIVLLVPVTSSPVMIEYTHAIPSFHVEVVAGCSGDCLVVIGVTVKSVGTAITTALWANTLVHIATHNTKISAPKKIALCV